MITDWSFWLTKWNCEGYTNGLKNFSLQIYDSLPPFSPLGTPRSITHGKKKGPAKVIQRHQRHTGLNSLYSITSNPLILTVSSAINCLKNENSFSDLKILRYHEMSNLASVIIPGVSCKPISYHQLILPPLLVVNSFAFLSNSFQLSFLFPQYHCAGNPAKVWQISMNSHQSVW